MMQNMNPQIRMIEHEHAGSTLKDIQMAINLRPALLSKDFDEVGKKEILKEIRYLEGYQLPKECVVIIKEYLLLPKNIYLSKKIFIQNITKVSLSRLNDILFVHFNNKVMNLTNTIIPLQIRRSSICRVLLNKVDARWKTNNDNMYAKLNALYFNTSSTSMNNDWIKQYDIEQDVFVWVQKPFKMRNKGKVVNINNHSITVALYKYITNNTTATRGYYEEEEEPATNKIDKLIWTNEIGELVIIRKSSNIMKIGENIWLDKVLETGLLIIH